VEFPYVECEGARRRVLHRPYLPVVLRHKGKRFFVPHALVDTGADMSILPLDIAHYLEIELDDTEGIDIGSAGGGRFVALPSCEPVQLSIEQKGHRPLEWKVILYFAPREPVVLLGHQHCLDRLRLLFDGPRKMLRVEH
jgi:hypothetical protein